MEEENYFKIEEQEDESTENTPTPKACKSCGGDVWRTGRKDAAQIARRNAILSEVREMFDSGKSEQEVREHFGAERNTYLNIGRYVTLFYRKHARK